MWSRTNLRSAVVLPCLAAVFAVVLAGCGYRLGTDMPSVLQQNGTAPGGALPTLKVKDVDNPTMDPSLVYAIRSRLRDEVGARQLARWVDSGKADYEIGIKVQSYTYRTWMRDKDDVSLLYSANMTLEGIVYRGDTNAVIWRSGNIVYSQTYESTQDKAATEDLVLNLIRQLVDRMRNNF